MRKPQAVPRERFNRRVDTFIRLGQPRSDLVHEALGKWLSGVMWVVIGLATVVAASVWVFVLLHWVWQLLHGFN